MTVDPYFTGDNGTGGYIEGGFYVGAQHRSPEEWARMNMKRCMYCHPDPVPPFPDCPHGHYLSPQRIEEQIRWDWIAEFGFDTLLWFGAVFLFRGLWILDVISTVFYLFTVAVQARKRHYQRRTQRLLTQGGPWAEGPNFMWQRRERRNEPWVRRIF